MDQGIGRLFSRILEETIQVQSSGPSILLYSIGLLLLGGIMVMATLAGIGIAPIMVPIGLVFFGLTVQNSIAHAATFSMMGFFTRVCYEFYITRSDQNKRKMNIHIAIVTGPIMTLGSFFGVRMNKIRSKLEILIGMVLLAGYSIYLTYNQYKEKSKKERLKQEAKEAEAKALEQNPENQDKQVDIELKQLVSNEANLGDSYKLMQNQEKESSKNQQMNSLSEKQAESKLEVTTPNPQEIAKVQKSVNSHLQQTADRIDIIFLVIIMSINPCFSFFTRVIKWAKENDDGICNRAEFILIVVQIIITLLLSVVSSIYVSKKNRNRQKCEISVDFTPSFLVKLVIGTFVISYLSTAYSVAISLLLILYFVQYLKIDVFSSSLTSQLLATLCFINSTILYVIDGRVSFILGVLGCFIVFVCSLGTRITVYQKIMDRGRESILMLFMIILTGLTIPVNIESIVPLVFKDFREGKGLFESLPFCS